MPIDLFGVYELKPFWQEQYVDDDYVGINLLYGLFGYSLAFWWLLVVLASNFGLGLLTTIGVPQGGVLPLLARPGVNLVSSVIISSLLTYVWYQYGIVFSEFDYVEHLNQMEEQITMGLDDHKKWKFYVILFGMILSGISAGLLYALIYLIPFFVLYFILIFLLGNFISLSAALFLVAALLSWSVFYYISSQKRINLSERPVSKNQPKHYPMSKRNLEILKSEQEPIICSNCRSFIPANSEYCPVCDHEIETQ